MWIKICGLTSAAAVDAALAAGVDAIGFVFADSPRRVTPADAARLSAGAHGRVRRVAVTRHPAQSLVDEILEVFAPDVLQSDAADLLSLRLPATLERLPVVRGAAAAPQPLAARLVFEPAQSGRGMLADWSAAQRLARRTQLVLAGGLNSGNVAEAIGRVAPFGVDVSSGVEERLGLKSPALIDQFVASVRAAAPVEPKGMT